MREHAPTNTIGAWIERWARTSPDAIALECRGATWSYQTLEHMAQRVADRLYEHGTRPGNLVALPAHRSPQTVALLLGILKAGCAYLPLEMGHPAARNRQILGRAHADVLLADDEADLVDSGLPVLTAASCFELTAPRRPQAISGELAYVMPTSGSTGDLKLVEITHASVHHNLTCLNEALGGITADDVYLHLASFAFSSSVRQLMLPLSVGARCVIATGTERTDPRELLRRMHASGVTVLDTIPSVLAVLTEALEHLPASQEAVEQLRLLLLASEPLPSALVRAWLRSPARPRARLYNMYGQTETAGIVCLQPIDPTASLGTVVPIGRPLPGTELCLLDDRQRVPADGATGEIVLYGPGVARGYRGDAALTAEHFAASGPHRSGGTLRGYHTGDLGRRTAEGTIAFVSRRDRMVKVRGQRTSLAEIEHTLVGHEAVAEAAVVDTGTDASGAVLRAFVRLRPGVLDAAVADRLRTLPNGLRVVDLNPRETDFLYAEIFDAEVYRQHGITVPENACIIDAGANIGLFTLSVATRYPTARVYAFEPAAPTAAALQANVLANGCDNVHVRVQGLSERPGPATLTFYPHSSGLTSLHADTGEERAHLVNIISYQLAHDAVPRSEELQEFTTDLADAKLVQQVLPCELSRLSDVLDVEGIETVDLLKVDVQKSETELLNGIREDHWDRIKQIVVEVHDIDGRLRQMAAHLTERGYLVTTKQDQMLAGSPMHYLYARRADARPAAAPTAAADRPAPATVSDEQLSSYLAARLPSYQVPVSVEILAALPRTVSGKLDRSALRSRRTAGRTTLPGPGPADPVTADIQAVWQEVLGKPVALTDDFFTIGGNSLSAARVITRIRARHTPEVTLRMIFQERRLDRFAAKVRSLLTTQAQ
ncbi:amino acid adenylation domain-containing protein [Streptomyces sp. NPDC056061]|uniref:amino acid adenylation domain-containing protein n=1 Tax=Streptomyces sp. NPDC056061 TaxID=3345700 RepID=UPI0035DE8FBF